MNLIECVEQMNKLVNEYFKSKDKIEVLEAGCGSSSKLKLEKPLFITGLDISQKQLDRNVLLIKKIKGDIETFKFNEQFDLVICWDVLEHLKNPINAIDNLAETTKSNGLLIIAAPNLMSFKGICTRLLPHFLHISFYKYVLGYKDAGKEDTVPFKTYLRSEIIPERIIASLESKGFKKEIYMEHDISDFFKIKKYPLYIIYKTIYIPLKVLSFGKIAKSDFILLMRKTNKTK